MKIIRNAIETRDLVMECTHCKSTLEVEPANDLHYRTRKTDTDPLIIDVTCPVCRNETELPGRIESQLMSKEIPT